MVRKQAKTIVVIFVPIIEMAGFFPPTIGLHKKMVKQKSNQTSNLKMPLLHSGAYFAVTYSL